MSTPGLPCKNSQGTHQWDTLQKANSAASAKQCGPFLVSISMPCAAVQDLSGAYTNLEAHCYQVEAEVRRLKEQLAQASAQASAQQPGELTGCICRQSRL